MRLVYSAHDVTTRRRQIGLKIHNRSRHISGILLHLTKLRHQRPCLLDEQQNTLAHISGI